MPRPKPNELKAIEEEEEAIQPVILLTQDDLNQLSPYLGKNIQTKDQLFLACQSLTTISVDGYEITLEPGLLHRIKSRCIDKRPEAFVKFLEKVVLEQLHSYVGW